MDTQTTTTTLQFSPTFRNGIVDRIANSFNYLPIRLKLSFIIGSIVVIVVAVFSLIVLKQQQRGLMSKMNQICNVLTQSLAETSKGDLLLDKREKLQEAVLRLGKMDIEGLEEVVILDRQFQIAASYSRDNSEIELPDEEWLSTLRGFKPREAGDTFQYVYPIFTQRKENGRGNVVRLGATYVSFSKKAIFDPIVHAQKIAISSAAGILFCSVIGILIISRKLTHQIKLLSDGARQVGYGNLDVEIDVRSNDELGQLTSEFNKMTQHLREKTQMQKFMSPLTVDMIRNTMGRNGERSKAAKKDVSVLFSDVRKFSTIAEQLAPEEIVKLVNVYFNLQTQVIESHNGIVDKFMGDQIMAIFQGHDMADDALRAAVEIQRKIRLLNQERQAEKKVVLEMGIGINNGPAVLGNMGSTNRMDYTVIGDVVNVASRLCTAAKSGQIIASLELAKRVNSSYPTSRLKSISVKGRRKAIEVCEVDYDRDILT